MSQVLTISCKLKVSVSQAAKLDATLDAFAQALNWVNENTPEKNCPVKAFKGGFVTFDAHIFSFREKDWTVSLYCPYL